MESHNVTEWPPPTHSPRRLPAPRCAKGRLGGRLFSGHKKKATSLACNGSGMPPLHSHLAKSSVMEACVNIDESLGGVDACPQAPGGGGGGGDFIVWWSNMIKHITVFRGEKSATLMLCPVLIAFKGRIQKSLCHHDLITWAGVIEVLIYWSIVIVYFWTGGGETLYVTIRYIYINQLCYSIRMPLVFE